MGFHPTTRKVILEHLDKGAFELRVATNFDALKGSPAAESLKAALARVDEARAWVREQLEIDVPASKSALPPVGEGLPLTRKERLGYRWP